MSKSTSRRAVLAGAITMPIAAAVTVPALAEADDAVVRLAAAVVAAYDRLGDAITAYEIPEAQWFRWRDSNPEPADKESAAWSNWLEREETFSRESGLDDADAVQKLASDKLHAARVALRDTRSRSLRGLSAKARLCEIDPDCLGHFMRPSIIADLLAMGGVQ